VIYVTSIYGAGEGNEDKITSKIITDLIYKKNKNVSYINNYYAITKNFYELTQKGDLILNMGAGDCHNFWSILKEKKGFFEYFSCKSGQPMGAKNFSWSAALYLDLKLNKN